MGISEATLYPWMQLYGRKGPSDLRKLRQNAEGDHKFTLLVADGRLDKAKHLDVLTKKV